jgi:hypothetical protein
MNTSRLDRLSMLSGAAGVVIMLIGILMFNYYEFMPPAEEFADFMQNNAAMVSTGGYIASLSTFFILWFAGSMRSVLVEYEGGNGRMSGIAFAGAIAGAVVLGISFVGIFATGLRAGAEGSITPVGAITMYDFWAQLSGQLFGIFTAVFIGATAIISLRTGLFPAWFGWASLVVAFGLLTPYAYAVLAFAILWLLVVSIWLYVRGASAGVPSLAGESI